MYLAGAKYYFGPRKKKYRLAHPLRATLHRTPHIGQTRAPPPKRCLFSRANESIGCLVWSMSPRVSQRTAALYPRFVRDNGESLHLVFRSLPDRRCPAVLLFRLSFRSARFFFLRAQRRGES